MLKREDVDSWNTLFPDCKINETNLNNPSEHFLTNALVSYLRCFGFNIEPPFNLNAENKENNKETRLFLIKLSRQIDHFLKITDKSYSFTYYDLIRPTPKKTAHMLSILLNYCYYYNMFKENAFKIASGRIRKLEDLRGRIDDTRRENELKAEENKNMKSTIQNLTEEVPMARKKLKELHDKRTEQEDEIQKLNHVSEELADKLKRLQEQKKLLRKRVVPEEEYQELQNQLNQLKFQLAEHKETESNISANLNECKETNSKLQQISKDIEIAYEIIPLRVIKHVEENNKQLARVQKEEHELQLRQNSIIEETDEENKKKLSLEKEQQIKHLELETKLNELMEDINGKRNILIKKEAEITLLKEKDHLSECQLEEQTEIAQYLQENISEVLSAYED